MESGSRVHKRCSSIFFPFGNSRFAVVKCGCQVQCARAQHTLYDVMTMQHVGTGKVFIVASIVVCSLVDRSDSTAGVRRC